MDRVTVELEHCYGIKSLTHTFDFAKGPAFAIYAPNGAMKSSLAHTFRDAQKGQVTSDRIFPNRTTVRKTTDEAGQQVEGDRVLVILSYDEEFGPTEQTCNLLVNPNLRDEYTKLHIEVDKAKDELIAALKAQSKSKVNIEAEVSAAFLPTSNDFIRALRRIGPEVSEQADAPYAALPYDKVFTPAYIDALESGDLKASIAEYIKRYDELLAASTYFRKGIFDYYNASEIARTLAKNGFFKAKHTVYLNSNGVNEEIKDEKDLEAVINREKEAILKDAKLIATFDKVAGKLDKNAGLREFREFLMDNPAVLARLDNVAQFKQDVWKSYLKAHEGLYADLLSKYEAAEKRRREIEEEASKERTQWEEVIDIFNSRFVVPFTLVAKNRVDVMLGNDRAIDLGFTYHDGADTAPVNEADLLRVLSMGERRALYILNVIFEVQTRLKLNQETLMVIDDIADSFDYQNKYAIVQYLKEIAEQGLFKQIIMTHNFDFFRTIESRFVSYPRCLMAQKTKDGIVLGRAFGIRNIFVKDWKENFFKDDRKKAASIPFLRNLIEFTRGEGEQNFATLTSMLHWKADTPTLTVGDLDRIYNEVCGGTGSSTNPNQTIVDLIESQAAACAAADGLMALEDKVVLAMGIRMRAEKHMAEKINDPPFVAAITAHQTQALLDKFRTTFPGDSKAISVLSRVALMTPENIHLNSFMYEPILDMSAEHLKRLYTDLVGLK